jgi:hypothetical protein
MPHCSFCHHGFPTDITERERIIELKKLELTEVEVIKDDEYVHRRIKGVEQYYQCPNCNYKKAIYVGFIGLEFA